MTSKTLRNQSKGTEIASHVRVANSFVARSRGLLGQTGLDRGHGLWIQASWLAPCNSIHTFFMRFAIDAVFVDDQLIAKGVYRNLVPWRLTAPILGATSVFELPAGTLTEFPVEIGDQLNVGD